MDEDVCQKMFRAQNVFAGEAKLKYQLHRRKIQKQYMPLR